MDYGPFLSTAVGIGGGERPVYKGIVVRLRTFDGQPTDLHAVFDTDLLAWRCVWKGELALRGIVFDGPHGTFPEIDGEPLFRMKALPGVAPARIGDVAAVDPREEPYGPIPTSFGRWSGLHLDGDDVILEYAIDDGEHRVFERVWAQPHEGGHAFVREITTESTGDGIPLVVVLDPATSAGDAASLTCDVPLHATGRGSVLHAPANGVVRLAIAPARTGLPSAPAVHPTPVQDAIIRARPRWGEPLVTRGVLDDPLDAAHGSRRIVRKAGDHAATIDIATAHPEQIVLLRDGAPVEEAPADEAFVVVRAPVASPSAFPDGDRIGWWPSDTGHGEFERNAFTSEGDLRLDGVTWRRGVDGRSLDFDGAATAWLDDVEIDLANHDLTVAAWIYTTTDGTIFAIAPENGDWAADGATLFLRNGQLSFDVGWVGVVSGGPRIDDAWWHHVAATWRHENGGVELFVDGERVASGTLPLKGDRGHESFVGRFGWTNDNFPATSRFSGYMDGPLLLRRAVSPDRIPPIAGLTGDALAEGTIVRFNSPGEAPTTRPRVTLDDSGERSAARLHLPRAAVDAICHIETRRGPEWAVIAWAADARREQFASARPFRVDRITWPEENPFHSWMRFGAFTLLPARDGNPTGAAITTWSGDVWWVDGLDEDLDELKWNRIATGLNQPFGITTRGNDLLVLGRDQITRLRDENGDAEVDYYENFSNLAKNSQHFHEPASGLLVTPEGQLLYHKAARHAKLALHEHHGSVVRVSPDGRSSEVVARGFRAPIGLSRLPDGTLLGSDQEGHWMPANRINLIRPAQDGAPPRFYGNSWAAPHDDDTRITRDGESVYAPWPDDADMTPPLIWLHPSFDRSPSSQVYIDHPAWGPLAGSIFGLSYGTGDVYLIMRDNVALSSGETIAQGAAVKLGVKLPTGLLDADVHPKTGDLYVCGLFGWSSDQTQPGGFYRVRPMADDWEQSLNIPFRFRALESGLEFTFLHPVDPESARNADNWRVQAWNYVRDADYGSADYALDGRRGARTTWKVNSIALSDDGRTLHLHIEDFEPAMQVNVSYDIEDAHGRPIDGDVQMTVHALHVGQE